MAGHIGKEYGSFWTYVVQ